MFTVKLKSKTESKYLIDLGCAEWVEINVKNFEKREDAAKYCKDCNTHTINFHPKRIGKLIYFIKEVK